MSRPLLPQVPPYLNAVPNPANVVQLTAAPTSAYVDQPLGTIGLYNGAAYLLTAKTSSTATWILLESSGGAGVFTTLSSTGLTNLNTTGTAATNIGVSGSTTTVLGTVNINATGAGVTTIGTGGTGAVDIGNATGKTTVTGEFDVTGNAVVTGNITASKSAAGVNVTDQVTNSDNTNGASNAGVEIAVGGASGGDPYLSFQISGVGASTMTMGLDNSASDTFVISNSTALGTSNALTLTQAGALTTASSISATAGSITASAGQVIAGGDTGGVTSTIALTNANSSTISTGVGSVKMSTANAATNTAWLKIYIGTNAFWIPAWTTNAP